MKIISLLLVIILSLGALCSCSGMNDPQDKIGPQGIQGETGPQGPRGEVGPQGEEGPAGKDGASFLTGKGAPSNDLGKVGDSYLDLTSDEWGFYVKGEDGWKLMGYIEADPPPLTLNDLNGSFALSHVVSGSRVYNIGDTYAGFTLSSDMIQVELNEGVGNLSANFASLQATNITCTIEYDKLIMICENAINITGQPSSVYELSMTRDGGIYVILEAYGDYYYVKKITDEDTTNNPNENKTHDVELFLHTADGSYNVTEDAGLYSDIVWEPGYIKTLYFSIKNNTSTLLYYNVSIEVTQIVNSLNEVVTYILTPSAAVDSPISAGSLDWSTGKRFVSGNNILTFGSQTITIMPGSEYFFALSLRMDETASNEYYGGDIDFKIDIIDVSST